MVGCGSMDESAANGGESGWNEESIEEDAPAELGVLEQALTGTHRVCSVIVGDNFRDTVLVPSAGWTRTTCKEYCVRQGDLQVQVACMSSTGLAGGGFGTAVSCTGGALPGLPPSNTCGW
jgi:hypothetical protein